MRCRIAPGLMLLFTALATTTARAAPLPETGTLDLGSAPVEQVLGWTAQEPNALAGYSVAGIGDFDGDGRDDVAVGQPRADTPAGENGGAVYVVFDARGGGALEDPAKAVTIRGGVVRGRAGTDVAAAGDINGDGLDDLLIGAPFAGPGASRAERVGEVYLVLGRRDHAPIDLAGDFGGVRITGADPGARFGAAVASMGDTGGDGRREIVVAAPTRNVGDKTRAGSVFVIPGRDAGDVNVGQLGEQDVLRLDGAEAEALTGRAVDAIGDLNGDHRPELLVAAPKATSGAEGKRSPNGAAYVVFGRPTGGVVELGNLGEQGYTITRENAAPPRREEDTGDWLGASISAVGDVNGDGRGDMVVGAPFADGPDRHRGGIAYVIFGKADTAPVDVAKLGDGGFRIVGVGADDLTGVAVSAAGDFDHDGFRDLAVSAPFADPVSRAGAGAVYVIFGRKDTTADVDLAEIRDRGIRIAGKEGSAIGVALDAAGDVDADGGDDLAIGIPPVDENFLFSEHSSGPGGAAIVLGAAGKPGEIPAEEIKTDPGYKEAIAAGCRPATNVQVVVEDNSYTDDAADPERIRLSGLQAYVAKPSNFGTVLGVSGFDESELSNPVFEPTELSDGRADTLKLTLKRAIQGEDGFPGYGNMFETLADDNPSAEARIMVVDGYLFREIRELRGLTNGSAPTYIVAIGHPPDRNATDIRQMKRIVRETRARYYEARSPRELERALQAIESRLHCDVEADNYQAELQPGETEDLDIVDIEEDVHSVDVTVTWPDPVDDFELDEVDIVDEDGDVVRRIDDQDIDEAYDVEDEDLGNAGPRARLAALPSVIGGRGRRFRLLHIRRIREGTGLRVTVRADTPRTRGRVYVRVAQSRRRR